MVKRITKMIGCTAVYGAPKKKLINCIRGFEQEDRYLIQALEQG
jgi:hypothetical protein